MGYQTPSFGLHVSNAAKDGGRSVRSRTHILGEMIEHLRHPGVGHMRAHRGGHRPSWAQGEKVEQQRRFEGRFDVDRVPQTTNRAPEEEAIRDLMHLRRVLQETPVTRRGPRGKRVETDAHRIEVGP